MKVCVIGVGYVGLITSVCLAYKGNDVISMDSDYDKIEKLNKGIPTIYESDLEPLLNEMVEKEKLEFTTNLKYGVESSDVVFVAVGTPPNENGSANLDYVFGAIRSIAKFVNGNKTIVIKSTVPVGTQKKVKRIVSDIIHPKYKVNILSNPEFLREGTAINDFFNADRIVIGADNKNEAKMLLRLYKDFNQKIIITRPESSELIKYSANAFLATKISFINEIANISEAYGSDIDEVVEGLASDHRINRSFLNAGVGYGGSCLPKDVKALIKIADDRNVRSELLTSVENVNKNQRKLLFKRLELTLNDVTNKEICILGASFKPNTDDVREAPSIDIINDILSSHGKVKLYDPIGMNNMKSLFHAKEIEYCKDIYTAVTACDAVVILTEWEEFKESNWKLIKDLMKGNIVIDGRNVLNIDNMLDLGFNYKCIGSRVQKMSELGTGVIETKIM